MSKLIDTDVLANAIQRERDFLIARGQYGAEHVLVHHFERIIEDVPTVDAIPVSWICDHIRQEDNRKNYKMSKYLTNMIWEWHQEDDDETD